MLLPRSLRRKRPRLPAGRRVYAIGDVHGEAGLLQELLDRIDQDARARDAQGRDAGGRPPRRTTLVLLGDFIDRGRHAADLLLGLYGARDRDLVLLKGNHEAALVDVYRGDEEALSFWISFGGRATLAGLGIDVPATGSVDPAIVLARLRDTLDERVIDWLDALPHSWSVGDYYFCHAGVRPGVPLARQDRDDLLWIREPFLSSGQDHGKVVVHGHTPADMPVAIEGNRIGIDTGAHETGRLTAVGLEGTQRWLVEAGRP